VAAPALLVVVDTEEEFDWSAPFDRRNTSVEHMRDIGRLQAVFDEFGVRPTYSIDYPIATQEIAAGPLRGFRESGRCDIAAHLHPWVNPPHEEEVNARNSYPGNLPRDLERRKIEALAAAIEEHLGVRPRVYKAGRYGFGPRTGAILEELGFEIDLSPCPAFDFRADGGPDHTRAPLEPRRVGRLVQIPATGACLGPLHPLGVALGPALDRLPGRGLLSRARLLERMLLSPEGHAVEDLRRLTRALLGRGLRTFSFSLHSPSIRPGCTPYVRDERGRVEFLEACRRYFDFFLGELGGVCTTPFEAARAVPGSPA